MPLKVNQINCSICNTGEYSPWIRVNFECSFSSVAQRTWLCFDNQVDTNEALQ